MKTFNKMTLRLTVAIIAVLIVCVAVFFAWQHRSKQSVVSSNLSAMEQQVQSSATQMASSDFGKSIVYNEPKISIDPGIAKPFDLKDVQNIDVMQKAYGFTFTDAELKSLSENKFVMKNILDTNIRPNSGGDSIREFAQMYEKVKGPRDYKARDQSNSIYFSSDVFFNAYNNLYTELLKEMENKTFYPAMKDLSKKLFVAANQKLATASTDADKQKWTKVRNYFAVPYAIFETAAQTLTQSDYQTPDGGMLDPDKVLSDYKERDTKVDTAEQASKFVKTLKLDSTSELLVLEDIGLVYESSKRAVPAIFKDEYEAYATQENIDLQVDFSQFTPRATYTSSSLRREYFRGMKWYIMLPFFVKSPVLTTYAYGVTQLLAEHPEQMKDYNKLESAINFMVGTSDDLAPADYVAALASAKDASDKEATAMQYLVKAHDPKIKDLAAGYKAAGVEQSDDVRLKTKGMRFFSGKYIVDSYWTGYLTQGDEAPRPGYTQKLPPMASMLEVMTLLGSDYAKTQIPKLDFYKDSNKIAIEQALGDLKKENDSLTDADWQKNIYTTWLWTIQSLFSWQQSHHDQLPEFMRSANWGVKTLQTAAAFWTELRHATILYAKQSFSELGGGGDGCDPREVPPPPRAYIEPQIQAYARLSYMAHRTEKGLLEQGYDLQNMEKLHAFGTLMDTVQTFVKKELENQTLKEEVVTTTDPDPQEPSKMCTHHDIVGTSDWETLRLDIINGLQSAIPIPVEGPVLPAKDRRAALVADVHTGGDSSYPTHILYEGEGVPYVIFTAVKDANGPRLTVGFVSSQYEFTKLYGGQRMTDEEWQKNFYTGDDPYDAYQYTEKSKWPKVNEWFVPLFK